MDWAMPVFAPQSQSFIALWSVFISGPADGERLSWRGWLVSGFDLHVIWHGDAHCLSQPSWAERVAMHRTDSCAPKEPHSCCGCTLAPPGEYDWIIRVSCPKQLNRSRCRLVVYFCGPNGLCIRRGCTLTPPAEWHWTFCCTKLKGNKAVAYVGIHVRQRVDLHATAPIILSAADALECHIKFFL